MPQLGSGAYPTASSIDSDDRFVAVVNGDVNEVPGSVAKTLMLPSGVVDAADYSALSAQVLVDCETTTGWTATSNATISTSNSHTQGTKSVSWITNWATSAANGKCYYTFSSPQAIGSRTVIALDLTFDTSGGVGHRPDLMVVKVADDVALTGNVNTVTIPHFELADWVTIILPLSGLSAIKSIGVERLEGYVASGQGNTRIDNIRFLDESPVDQALGSASGVGVIVGGNYSVPSTQMRLQTETDKHVLDLGRGSYSGFNRVMWLDSYYIDPTGATDVTARFTDVINSAPAYSTIKAPAGALYRFDSNVHLGRLNHVTIDLSEATCFITWEIDQNFITIDDSSYVKLIVGQMFGFHDVTQNGSTMSSLAGSPTVVSTTYTLDAQDEAVKGSSDSIRAWPMARTLNQQVGLAGTDIPKWHYKFSLSDTNQVASDVMLYAYDSVTLEVLASETVTLTGSPADYWLSFNPEDTHVLPLPAVKKLTATANTISVHTYSRYGRVNYDAAYDTAAGVEVTDSHHITICGPEGGWGVIEGFGGDGLQFSDPEVSFVEIRNILSSGNRRQGISTNSGREFLIEHCKIENPGRSGLDIEPYTDSSLVENVTCRDVEIWNARNYAIAFVNWARAVNTVLEDIRAFDPGVGFCVGGSRGGRYTNWWFERKNAVPDYELQITGQDLVVDGIHTTSYIYLTSSTTGSYNGQTYTARDNCAMNLSFYGITDLNDSAPSGSHRLRTHGSSWRVDGVAYPAQEETDFNVGVTGNTTSIGMNVTDGTRWASVDFGETARQIGNTFKGQAFQSVWIPGGFNHLDEPVYRVHSLSGTTTRGNNLRGIAAAVSEGLTTVTVAFASQQPGTFTSAPSTFSWTGSGSLVAGTTYYYRVAPRTRWIGPRTYAAQLTRLIATGQSVAMVKMNAALDLTNDILLEGWTILRGTTNGGPYTHRYDVVPNGQLWGHTGRNIELLDKGSTIEFAATLPTSGIHGYAQSYNVSTGSWTGSVDESGYEPDTSYGVLVTPSWLTTVRVTSKTTAGFTVDFGTAAPVGATFDWFLVR